jgi:hypothetical protein
LPEESIVMRHALACAVAAASLLLPIAGCSGPPESGNAAPGNTAPAPEIESLSGPYASGTLQVWLVHGPDQHRDTRRLVPLAAALQQGIAVVHETGDVNELAIENVGADADVYVQAGDIVQGGKQDRTIGVDLVLAPKSGRVPLPSFCVEHGRWSAREAPQGLPDTLFAPSFVSSSNTVSTNAMKRALLVDADQQQVWNEVSTTQSALNDHLGKVVNDPSSPSSLELTLESKAVKDATANMVQALLGLADGKGDAIGCVVAIAGKFDSADVYGSHPLFAALWPKLLRSAATAAVAGGAGSGAAATPSLESVRAFLCEPQGERQRRDVAGVRMAVGESAQNHVVDSRDGGGLLHRTWLAK